MIESIRIWILNIVTIIIFISFLEILMPNGNMKKYLNLVLGFIVMIVILNPIINLLKNNLYLEDELFSISQEFNQNEYQFIANNIEMIQREQLNSLYKDNLKREIQNRIESRYEVDVVRIDIDIEKKGDKGLGKIKEIRLDLAERKQNVEEDEIPIVSINVMEEDNTDEKKNDVAIAKKIKEDISNIYNINDSNIIVN